MPVRPYPSADGRDVIRTSSSGGTFVDFNSTELHTDYKSARAAVSI